MSVATFMRRLGLVVTAVWLVAGQARADIYAISNGTFGNDASKKNPTGLADGTFSGTFTANLSKSGGTISEFNIELYTKNNSKTAFMHLDVSKSNIKVSQSGSGSNKVDIFSFKEGSVTLSLSLPSADLGVGTVPKDKTDTLSEGNASAAVASFQMTDKSTPIVTAAPEPSTFLPAICGIVAFAGYFWRRRSRAIAA